jgi:hypothetical protein
MRMTLLLSADFFAFDFIYNHEFPGLMQAVDAREVTFAWNYALSDTQS